MNTQVVKKLNNRASRADLNKTKGMDMRDSTKNNTMFIILLGGVIALGVMTANDEINKSEQKEIIRLEIQKTKLEIEKLNFELAIYREQESLVVSVD